MNLTQRNALVGRNRVISSHASSGSNNKLSTLTLMFKNHVNHCAEVK